MSGSDDFFDSPIKVPFCRQTTGVRTALLNEGYEQDAKSNPNNVMVKNVVDESISGYVISIGWYCPSFNGCIVAYINKACFVNGENVGHFSNCLQFETVDELINYVKITV